ncbi:hypothetical protein QWJ34_00515 [Saccharibacillus sp. CPCC 101409]|uniref:hypothetical protein n=1 Tax=Saccharibacillus sp. CPCC 101409 TaxID=3058041 RepID=UPI0026741421|nr:hypothetical protein [Saccharibacillus sp. CPCC 101409]MDO3408240.1 hypothetical protein [Saccharibacillus sp. CPCC 101409]
MLTFDKKIAILDSFPELERKDVSLGRVNYHYPDSAQEKKTVAFHFHKNGNGFVYAGLVGDYETDDKGLVNVRDYTEAQLREIVDASIRSLAPSPGSPAQGACRPSAAASAFPSGDADVWTDAEGQELTLRCEDETFFIYSGSSLEMAFETHEEAEEYLAEEGFSRR